MALKEYRDTESGGFMTMSQGVGVSAGGALFAALIMTAFMFLYVYYLVDFNSVMDEQMQKNISKLKEKGMSDEEIRSSSEMGKKLGKIFAPITVGIATFIFDFIVGLIAAAIMKKS
jgi:hypothetical protein